MVDEHSNWRVTLLNSEFGIHQVFHIAPLHYLPFIARTRRLLARPKLKDIGYADSHFRKTSHQSDASRGFGDRVFLSTIRLPPILLTKLEKGFPHVRFDIAISALQAAEFDLCRYNVAKNRSNLRGGPVSSHSEGGSNGRYYDGKQLPVARSSADMAAMLRRHWGTGQGIEVQVRDSVPLPDSLVVTCFSEADQAIAASVILRTGRNWKTTKIKLSDYRRSSKLARQVEAFCERALTAPDWKGDGLDFDRLT
jgi:hypothetical protein